MSHYTGPKAKLCRAYGVNLFGSPKYDKILAKKGYGPGIHGGKRKKISQYGKQLRAKKITSYIYGDIKEKQFRNYYVKASRKSGDTGENLLQLLECRLDNVVYKSGFANTIWQARQMVNHGHIVVNGVKANIASIQMKTGDIITVKENKQKLKLYQDIRGKKLGKNSRLPSWLKVDYSKLQIEIVEYPGFEHFDPLINIKAVVEFYSR